MCIHCDQYAILVAELQDQVWNLQQALERFMKKQKIPVFQDSFPEEEKSLSLNHYAYTNEDTTTDTASSKE